MLAERDEIGSLKKHVLQLLQEEVAKLARCTPEEVGEGNVEEVGLDSRPMLLVLAIVEVRLGHERLLRRQDITPEILTNLSVLSERLAMRALERKG